MKVHRFFIEQKINEKQEIVVKEKNLINQWKNVLRLKTGGSVILFDGGDFEFQCVIENLSKDGAKFSVAEKRKVEQSIKFELELFPAFIKKDRFEWILEKGVELGVKKFSPIISERSIKQKINLERSRKIIKEAAEQSGKNMLAEISEPRILSEVIKNRASDIFYFALDPRGEKFSLEKIRFNKAGVFIGPEGGFAQKEIESFKNNDIPVYSLGNQILRTETAAISITAKILLN